MRLKALSSVWLLVKAVVATAISGKVSQDFFLWFET